jgi:hypothetical protein
MDELLTPLTDALALLHDAKVLHRDIKPANICIREEAGDPVLLDFGASKYSLSEMTGTTAAIVSCGYSPYEAYAAHSKQQGAWTDIYGLGATVYRALGNGPPPEATARVLNDSMVPLHSQRLPGFRPEFLAAVDWALSVQPRNRPQSVAEWQPRLLAGSSNTAALGRQARPVLVTGTDARAPSLEAAAGRAPRRRATALGLAALLLLGGGAGLALGIGWIPSTLAPWLGEDASYRQRAVEEARPQAALARASAEAEDHKARDAEHRRIAAIRAEQDDKARDAERQRLASLKAEEDRKARDAERQRLTAAPKTAEPNKPTTDPRSRASRCAPQARITWKRTNGWGALAVGATNCGFSWGLRNKVVAEWRALDWCRRKSTDCKIVEYNQ